MQIDRWIIIIALSLGLTACSEPRTPPDPKPNLSKLSKSSSDVVLTQAKTPKMTIATAYGDFSGNIKAEWLENGQMRLLENFAYQDKKGTLWIAPKDAVVNGASIPSKFWGFIGGPFSGKYRKASVIHDVACVERKRPWPMVHRAFYTAMRAGDVSSTRAKIMYAAVRFFGPRWKSDGTRAPTPNKISDKQFEDLKAQIESGKLSLDQIDDFQ